ncbi:MAG TPA: cupredoxin domain-containing protein [Candidatus Nanoarchaeia archaeon]|nr:cupredoxin domain-containing protein [Candidatus Nanoarchaeia archaeon]
MLKRVYVVFLVLVLVISGCQQAAKTEDNSNINGDKQVDTPPVINDDSDEPVDIPSKEVTINMKARKWEFEPSTITVKKGDKVKLLITGEDVKHGFKLTDFNINEDIEPGKTTTIEFTADKIGTFSFMCSVFCGSGHSDMEGKLIVE